MNILILHRIPYHKIDYHLGIDHQQHDVTYIGVEKALANLPAELRCRQIKRAGLDKTSVEVAAWLQESGAQFERVISLSEYELMDAALLREQFGIPGALPAAVEKVRNKMVMKHVVLQAGIAAPRYLGLQALLAANGEASWQGKTVLKPVDGASSEDVCIFGSPQEVLAALQQGRTGVKSLQGDTPDLSRFECEEFIQGPILHYDGLVFDGLVLVMTASRYIGTCLAFAQGEPLGSAQFAVDDETRAWVSASLKAVGISEGSFHLEAIEREGKPVFLEVANRVGGADVVATFEQATGVHLPSAELKILIGETPDITVKSEQMQYCGWFVFPGHHLEFAHGRLQGHQRFASAAQMLRWNQLDPSQALPRNITYQAMEVPAAGIVQGPSSEDIIGFMQEMFAGITVQPVDAKADVADVALAT